MPVRLAIAALGIVSVGLSAAAQDSQPSQTPPATTRPATTRPETEPVGLPEAWFGTWRGQAVVLAPGGSVGGRYGMGLEIRPSADAQAAPAGGPPVYDWAITYEQGDQRQTRPYLLRVAADEQGTPRPGHFVLDERNGTLVDQFLVGDVMEGHFIVTSQGRRLILHGRYELTSAPDGQPAIRVEIASYDGEDGGPSAAGESGVRSRRLLRVQRALLVRQ